MPDSETWVFLRDDLFAGIHFFSVVGPDQESIATELRKEFDPWTEPELFAWWDRGVERDDVDDRVDAVLFLGVNAPEQPREEYVKRIRAALADSDKDVRNAAVAATAYADWRVFRPDLERGEALDSENLARWAARCEPLLGGDPLEKLARGRFVRRIPAQDQTFVHELQYRVSPSRAPGG